MGPLSGNFDFRMYAGCFIAITLIGSFAETMLLLSEDRDANSYHLSSKIIMAYEDRFVYVYYVGGPLFLPFLIAVAAMVYICYMRNTTLRKYEQVAQQTYGTRSPHQEV
jgi:hypothetical protein